MKKLLISLIHLYQKLPLKSHSLCRFRPTCSDYAIEAINRYGVFKGLHLTVKRILRCNPCGSFGYDPVPLKENLK